MSGSLDLPDFRMIAAAALAEDLGVGPDRLLASQPDPALLSQDVSSSLIPHQERFSGVIRGRSRGVVCGLPVATEVFDMLSKASASERVETEAVAVEGSWIEEGQPVLEVAGPASVVLAAERTALDFLMVLSGIATTAGDWQAAAGGVHVVDTRKTYPGLRALSKYAVRVGGAVNHRQGLYDMVLIKDNHIRSLGGIASAVRAAREAQPSLPIEVEADSAEQAAEAAAAGADMVLLDNMDDARLALAVAAVRASTPAGRSCLIEASGGITFDRLPRLAAIGVDRVSSSALTFARPLDFGLDQG